MRSLDNARDQQGEQTHLRPISDTIYQLDLVANVQERVAIPTGATRVIFASNCNYWVKAGDSGVNVANTGDISDGSSGELNPAGYTFHVTNSGVVDAYTHFAVKSDDNGLITMAFYS